MSQYYLPFKWWNFLKMGQDVSRDFHPKENKPRALGGLWSSVWMELAAFSSVGNHRVLTYRDCRWHFCHSFLTRESTALKKSLRSNLLGSLSPVVFHTVWIPMQNSVILQFRLFWLYYMVRVSWHSGLGLQTEAPKLPVWNMHGCTQIGTCKCKLGSHRAVVRN